MELWLPQAAMAGASAMSMDENGHKAGTVCSCLVKTVEKSLRAFPTNFYSLLRSLRSVFCQVHAPAENVLTLFAAAGGKLCEAFDTLHKAGTVCSCLVLIESGKAGSPGSRLSGLCSFELPWVRIRQCLGAVGRPRQSIGSISLPQQRGMV